VFIFIEIMVIMINMITIIDTLMLVMM